MNRVLSRRGVLAILVILASLLFVYQSRVHDTTALPLTEIQSVDTLREQFDRDVGRPRLILLVSPT